jgi:hypothetical protein
MKISNIALAATLALSGSLAYAQIKPGSPEKQPSSSAPSYDTSGKGHTISGSGTSSSGGKDENGDEGRDKMPEASAKVKPTPGKPDIPNASNQK